MGLTINKLIQIEHHLTTRDKQILELLRSAKCLYTYHIRRILFTEAKTEQAAGRAVNRNLKKLKDLGLIGILDERNIGGIHSGSSPYIWFLTEHGHRLLGLEEKYPEENKSRKRVHEPALSTIRHQMAVAECFTKLTELGRSEDEFRLKAVTFEPDNWKDYARGGKTEQVKPDLEVVTSAHGYECRWFIEMDLGTESLETVLGKCLRYARYYKSNLEQKRHGVFPVVLWIVQTEKRKEKIEYTIKKHLSDQDDIFIVITGDELKKIMLDEKLLVEKLC